MKNIITAPFVLRFFLLLVVASLSNYWLNNQGKINLDSPKLAVYYTSPEIRPSDTERLARFDLIILDMENTVNNAEEIAKIKKLNPNCKILVYANPFEFFNRTYPNRPLQNKLMREVQEKYPSWYVKQPDGSQEVFYHGMEMLNLSDWCPEINGYKWNRYHAEFMINNVFNQPNIDGYFMDNSGGNIWWLGRYGRNHGIDVNGDGKDDDEKELNRAWKKGVRDYLATIRQAMGKKFIMVGNKGTVEFIDLLDGKMFENFPNDYLGDKTADGWYQSIENYHQTGPYSIIHARQIAQSPEYRKFILASALMGDGFYAYGQDVTIFFPEYRKIGKPIDQAVFHEKERYYERHYDLATVKVWPELKKGEIIYK